MLIRAEIDRLAVPRADAPHAQLHRVGIHVGWGAQPRQSDGAALVDAYAELCLQLARQRLQLARLVVAAGEVPDVGVPAALRTAVPEQDAVSAHEHTHDDDVHRRSAARPPRGPGGSGWRPHGRRFRYCDLTEVMASLWRELADAHNRRAGQLSHAALASAREAPGLTAVAFVAALAGSAVHSRRRERGRRSTGPPARA